MSKGSDVPRGTINESRLRPIKGTIPDLVVERLKNKRVFALVRVNLVGDVDIVKVCLSASISRKVQRLFQGIPDDETLSSRYYVVPFELPKHYYN